MRELLFGSSDKLEIRGANVSGFNFGFKVSHGTDNTAFAANPIVPANVFVKCTLYRKKQAHVLFADSLLPLALESAFYSGAWDQLNDVGTIGYQRLVVAAAATREVVLQTVAIRFHEVVNVAEDDVLLLEIQANSNAIDGNSSTSLSRLLYDYIEGIGNGFSIPFIRSHSLRASISSDKIGIGNDVVSVKFINTDKSGIATANQVLSSIAFQSDKLKISDSYEELLIKRAEAFHSNADHALRNQCFDLVSVSKDNFGGHDVRMQNCDLHLQLNSANVNASENWIVWRGYVNEGETYVRAIDRERRHVAENASQYAR